MWGAENIPVTYDAAECLKCIQACWRVREKGFVAQEAHESSGDAAQPFELCIGSRLGGRAAGAVDVREMAGTQACAVSRAARVGTSRICRPRVVAIARPRLVTV